MFVQGIGVLHEIDEGAGKALVEMETKAYEHQQVIEDIVRPSDLSAQAPEWANVGSWAVAVDLIHEGTSGLYEDVWYDWKLVVGSGALAVACAVLALIAIGAGIDPGNGLFGVIFAGGLVIAEGYSFFRLSQAYYYLRKYVRSSGIFHDAIARIVEKKRRDSGPVTPAS